MTAPTITSELAPSKPRTRDREQTSARIVQAVGEVLSRDGFAGIGINAIAKQAGVDKVLIYRYYGGLPELLKAYGQSGGFWPTVQEVVGDDPQLFSSLTLEQRYCQFLEHFVDALRARPLTLEILAQELIDRNELTAILEEQRQQWGEQASQVLGGDQFARVPGGSAVTILLIAGVQYLLLRSRKIRIFGQFDLRSDESWLEIKRSIRVMVRQWFAGTNNPPQ